VPNLSKDIDYLTSLGPGYFKQITFRINFKEHPEFQLPFGTAALPIHQNDLRNMLNGGPKIVIESVN